MNYILATSFALEGIVVGTFLQIIMTCHLRRAFPDHPTLLSTLPFTMVRRELVKLKLENFAGHEPFHSTYCGQNAIDRQINASWITKEHLLHLASSSTPDEFRSIL